MTSENHSEKRVVIVGGGFGGVRCALDLAARNPKRAKVKLVSDKSHFEYTPALYRVVSGRSPLEVCIPLRQIFDGTEVEIVEDKIGEIALRESFIRGNSGSVYKYDYLVLALGSETKYFDIPGLRERSFSFKSISEALRLKRHIHELFSIEKEASSPLEKVSAAHFVIVGGGSSGTELAGDLSRYLSELARKHKFPNSFITIDLVEASHRLVSALPEDVSEKIKRRLHKLGVNIFLNRPVVREEVEKIYLKDMELRTRTVIWAAGVKPNSLYVATKGFKRDRAGRVSVDEFLRAEGLENVFILGDGASTSYTGMAQTAIGDGAYAARVIYDFLSGNQPAQYQYVPRRPYYIVPAGPGWAAALIGEYRLYGRPAWILRRLADLRFFLSILPARKAWLAWRSGRRLCESCPVCSEGQ